MHSLTSFSVTYAQIEPNTLNPSADSSAPDAITIYIVVGVLGGVWILICLGVWHNEKTRVMVLKNIRKHFVCYRIILRTGEKSGTTSRIYIAIHGSKGQTERLLVSHGIKSNAQRSILVAGQDIGQPFSVTIDSDRTGLSPDFEPCDVIIQSIVAGFISMFHAKQMIRSKSHASEYSCKIFPAVLVLELNSTGPAYETKQIQVKFWNKVSAFFFVNIKDQHLWLSTILAPVESPFTRPERTSMCFLILFGKTDR